MSNIIKEHLVECEAWRETCEEHFDEALAQGCVRTLNNYTWVSWEKPPEFEHPYHAWDMGAEFARIMIKRQIEQQQAQLEECYALLNEAVNALTVLSNKRGYAGEKINRQQYAAGFRERLTGQWSKITAMGE